MRGENCADANCKATKTAENITVTMVTKAPMSTDNKSL